MTNHEKTNYGDNGLEEIPLVRSWTDFYESYDGKFDEQHMLHITIHAHHKNELESLGYKPQKEEDDWHKPAEGEYKLNDEGNLVIIHGCPDREIFKTNPRSFLEELCINEEWVTEATLSIM